MNYNSLSRRALLQHTSVITGLNILKRDTDSIVGQEQSNTSDTATWPTHAHDIQNTGRNATVNPPNTGLSVDWSYFTGEIGLHDLTDPIITSSTVFTASARNNDEIIVKLNPDDGTAIDRFDINFPDPDTLFPDYEPTTDEIDSVTTSGMSYSGGDLYVNAIFYGPFGSGRNPGSYIYKVNARTGDVEWTRRVAVDGDSYSDAAPRITGDRVYFGNASGFEGLLDIYDARTGAVIYNASSYNEEDSGGDHPNESYVDTEIAIQNGVPYFPNPYSGEIVAWQDGSYNFSPNDIVGRRQSYLSTDETGVFATTYFGNISKVDLDLDSVIWRTTISPEFGDEWNRPFVNSYPVHTDNTLIAGISAIKLTPGNEIEDTIGEIVSVDKETGGITWREQTDGIVMTMSGSQNYLYVGVGQKLRIYDIQTGNVVREVNIGEYPYFGPSLGSNSIYVVTSPDLVLRNELNVISISGSHITPTIETSESIVSTGEPVTFDASDSIVEVSNPEYQWAFGENAEFTASGQQVVHTFEDPGEHSVRLRISTDDNQRTGSVTVPVVEPSIETTPTDTTVNNEVTLDASNSTVPVENPTYEWAFGADAEFNTTGQQVTHTFSQSGEYTVRLRVSVTNHSYTTSTTVPVTAQSTPTDVQSEETAVPTDVQSEETAVPDSNADGPAQSLPMDPVGLGGAALGGSMLLGLGVWRYHGTGMTAPPVETDRGVSDWQLLGQNPRRTAGMPTAPGPVASPETAWQATHDDDTINTTPVVSDDRAVVATSDGTLQAIDLATGDTDWTTYLDADEVRAPLIRDDTIYVGSADSTHAYALMDGEQRWRTPVGSVSMVTGDDAVYVGIDGDLRALHPATGGQRWQTDLDNTPATIATANNTVYVATDTAVTALDAGTGDQRWQINASGRDPSLAVGESLVVSSRAGVAALALHTGEQQWIDNEGGRPTPVALAHDRIYQATDTAVRALDDQTGTESWRTPLDATTGPVVVGDTVYVGTPSDLVALDAADGEYQFTHDVPGVQGGLAVVGNAVICQTSDGALTTVTAELGDAPDLHRMTTSATVDTTEKPDDERTGAAATNQETRATADSSAGRFARDCGAVDSAMVVDESGPVHVYDGQFLDEMGEEDARIYALSPKYAADQTAVDAFETAAREWQGISKNTHIATVFDSSNEPRPWVAFDAGKARLDETLASFEGTAGVDSIVDLAEAVRTGSMYNLAHESIAPDKVFITEDTNEEVIVTLADWGLQRAVERVIDTLPVTPYTAPEQLDGASAGTQTDIYQLGAVAYHILTGKPPFADVSDQESAIADGELTPPTEHDPTLPDGVDAILADAMATDPADRLPSAYDLRQRLLNTMGD